jgi:hypothetical protein
MAKILQEALSATPWWIFALLIYLLLAGRKLMTPRTFPSYKLFPLPLFLSAWSFIKTPSPLLSFTSWALSLSLSFFCFKQIEIKKKQIFSQGSRLYLFPLMLFFSLNYLFFQLKASVPPLLSLIYTLLSSLISGFFLGRAFKLAYLFKRIKPL